MTPRVELSSRLGDRAGHPEPEFVHLFACLVKTGE